MSDEHDNTMMLALGMSRLQKTGRRSRFAFFNVVYVIVFLVLLSAFVSGVLAFRSVAESQLRQREQRTSLSLIANSIHSSDEVNAVVSGTGPEGSSLVLVNNNESGTYETRIYLYQGSIVEEYALAGSPYSPESASELVASNTFGFSYSDGILTIVTDQGSVEVALRTVQGSAS